MHLYKMDNETNINAWSICEDCGDDFEVKEMYGMLSLAKCEKCFYIMLLNERNSLFKINDEDYQLTRQKKPKLTDKIKKGVKKLFRKH